MMMKKNNNKKVEAKNTIKTIQSGKKIPELVEPAMGKKSDLSLKTRLFLLRIMGQTSNFDTAAESLEDEVLSSEDGIKIVPQLIHLAEIDEPFVRQGALRALHTALRKIYVVNKIQRQKIISASIDALNSEAEFVRLAAAYILADAGNKEAFSMLEKIALSEKCGDVKEVVFDAMKKIMNKFENSGEKKLTSD